MNEVNGVTQWRIARVEQDIKSLDGIPERVSSIEQNMQKLESSINRLVWAIIGFAFTVAGSAIALLLTTAAH